MLQIHTPTYSILPYRSSIHNILADIGVGSITNLEPFLHLIMVRLQAGSGITKRKVLISIELAKIRLHEPAQKQPIEKACCV